MRPRLQSGDCGRPLNFTVRRQRQGRIGVDGSLCRATRTARYFTRKFPVVRNYALRRWKGIDWEATNRLFERGLIDDPKGKAKSILFTSEGLARAKAAAERLFAP